ncbi:MAG: divalent-cation tolerance protein CutA [Hyphomicrobium sp.]
MDVSDDPVLIYSTFPDVGSAEEVGRYLIESKLAACVNIIPNMISLYNWQGAVQKDQECVLIIKTRSSLSVSVIEEARKRHTYTTPAFLTLPIIGGYPPYVEWLMNNTLHLEMKSDVPFQ